MTAPRFLVLHLRALATDRLVQAEPTLQGQPLAVWTTIGNRRLLTAVDAPGTRLHAGQALADAQAMYPDLVLRPAEPEADLALLERLALWCLRFTPEAAVDAPDGLVLNIAGCTELFGGEAPLLARISAGLARGGIAARAVIPTSRTLRRHWPAPGSTASSCRPVKIAPWSRAYQCRCCACRPTVWRGCCGSDCSASATCCASPVRRCPGVSGGCCWTRWMRSRATGHDR